MSLKKLLTLAIPLLLLSACGDKDDHEDSGHEDHDHDHE